MEGLSIKPASISIVPFTLESIWQYHSLVENGYKIREFIDIATKYWNKEYQNTPIHRDIDGKSDKYFIIHTKHDYAIKERILSSGISEGRIHVPPPLSGAEKQRIASQMGMDEIVSLLDNIYDTEGGGISEIKRIVALRGGYNRNLVFNTFDIYITECCTLRCDGCIVQTHYFQHPQHIPLNDIVRDVDILMDNVDFVNYVHILGGEPFLYPYLDELIYWIRNSDILNHKIGYFNIITNGTIVPNQRVIKSLQGSNIGVYISDYGEFSTKIDEIEDVCKNYHIRCLRLGKTVWFNGAQLLQIPTKNEDFINKRFLECINKGNGCKFIRNGRFYYCPFLCNGEVLGLIPYSAQNSINLLSPEFNKEILANYLQSQRAVPGCAYCNGYGRQNIEDIIPAARQLSKPKEYFHY